jgi:hypothetical protein
MLLEIVFRNGDPNYTGYRDLGMSTQSLLGTALARHLSSKTLNSQLTQALLRQHTHPQRSFLMFCTLTLLKTIKKSICRILCYESPNNSKNP